jgi:hypothetical protein
MLFRMVEILFGLFIWNSNGELRRTTTISSPPWNSRIAVILTISEQRICVWMHNCYSYSENSSYSAIPDPSKHTRLMCYSQFLYSYAILCMIQTYPIRSITVRQIWNDARDMIL